MTTTATEVMAVMDRKTIVKVLERHLGDFADDHDPTIVLAAQLASHLNEAGVELDPEDFIEVYP